MRAKRIELYLKLLNCFLENRVYDYKIRNISINENNYLIVRVLEIAPFNGPNSEYDLIIRINDNDTVSFTNIDGFDCIYDFLEEQGMTKKEADQEMLKYKSIIQKYK